VTIEVQRLETATELRDAAETFLMRNEAHHNLILGLIERLAGNPRFYDSQPYFAVARAAGETVAAAVMTPPHPLVLSLSDDEAAIAGLARDALAFLPLTAGVNSPLPGARRFAAEWQRLSGERTDLILAERCYKLERLRPPEDVPGQARRATEGDLRLLTEWQIAFVREAVPSEEQDTESTRRGLERRLGLAPESAGTLIWEDGGVPVCMVGYGSPTPNSLRIAPVYTPPEHRRRGYAGACTAEACRYVLDSGKAFVTLFADLANATSNHVYQGIGFEPVCDAEVIRFGGR
jgi:hypothetical protein